MAGILDDVMGAVGAVQTISGTAAAAADPENTAVTVAPSTDDRLAALENFVITWGPALEKLAPLIEKL